MAYQTACDLSQAPLTEHLLDLVRERSTGELRLERGRARKVFGVLEGGLVSVDSSLPSESLCVRLRESGQLEPGDVARAEAFAREHQTTRASALTSLRLIEPKQLIRELRARIAASAGEAMLWTHGTCLFDRETAPAEPTRALRCEVLPLVHATLRSSWPAERIAMDLVDRFQSHPAARPGLADRLRPLVDDDASTLRLMSLLDGDHTLEAVIGAVFAEPALLAALWVADRIRLLHYTASRKSPAEHPTPFEFDIVSVRAKEGARDEPRLAPPDSTPAAPPEAEEVGKNVLDLHAVLGESNHYEMLGVEPDAAGAVIKKAYFEAAKRYHPDKLARLGLANIKDQASEVFAAIAEAHEVLSDTDRRRCYDETLASGGANDDIDVSRIAQAENSFRKGEVLVKMGDFRGAAALLATAVELWPDECLYQATLGWALLRKNPPEIAAAVEALRTAVTLDGESAQAHRWLGQVLRAQGDVEGAAEHTARARKLDPEIG